MRLSGRETPVTNCFSAREWRRQFCVSGRTGGCLSALLVSVPCPGLTLCGYQDVKLQLLTVSVPESGGDSSALAAGLVAVFLHCSCQCHVPG